MQWITRERPKIDRIACPWLIARFIDKAPEFLYVPASEVLSTAKATAAIPYDIPNVELSHVGELCSFDSFLTKYRLHNPALDQLARIVRGAERNQERLLIGPTAHAAWWVSRVAPGLYARIMARKLRDELA